MSLREGESTIGAAPRRPGTQAISYRGRVVAWCTAHRFFLSEEMERRPRRDPERRFVLAMVLYTFDVIHGCLPGPCDEASARRYAQAFIIPDELLGRDRLDIVGAAEWLAIPIHELVAARFAHHESRHALERHHAT